MQNEYKSKGVVLIALSNEPASKVAPFIKDNKINYIVGAEAAESAKEYAIPGFPTIFVINPKGEITYKGHSGDQAEEAVKTALKETPPTAKGGLYAGAAKSAIAKADKLAKDKKYAKALKAYEDVAKKFKGSKAAKTAKAKIKKMKADKKVMAAINKASEKKDCESWLQLARNLAKAGKADEARKYYERILKKYPDSKYADTAKNEMAALDT